MKAFKIYLSGNHIDTIFYSDSDQDEAADVKRSLINHDGYDPSIEVANAADEEACIEARERSE